MKHKDIAPCF